MKQLLKTVEKKDFWICEIERKQVFSLNKIGGSKLFISMNYLLTLNGPDFRSVV